ncbi:MAG: tRNA (adenosine(37)-N6)-threonylcarbamoyltransferase complex ATPase subunit type 1 TsaE [Lachnospiraceae bacterium]|nr:tRNA (adenosine(37)-N6)-threonylcarbamoyltransferase complex ATPase subunit type 1 TsaE [Lachnospiraceae bacterium]
MKSSIGEIIVETDEERKTYELGVSLGESAAPGEVYALTGDLGTGKTVFAKGVAKGLGIKETVNSPTFTIVQDYEEGRMPFYHFDLYRLGSPEELEEIGYEDFFYGEGLCLVEWAELFKEILPDETGVIMIEKDALKGTDYRRITLKGKAAERISERL